MTDLSRRMRLTGIKDWPYGVTTTAAQRAVLDWAEASGVRMYLGAGCLHWLSTGRCTPGSRCTENRSTHRWMDHATYWTRKTKPAVLVAHPYELGADDRADLDAVAAQYHLDVRVTENGWYGHDTMMIELHAPNTTNSAAGRSPAEQVHEHRVNLGPVAPFTGELELVYRTTNPDRDSEDCYLVQHRGNTTSEIHLGRMLPHDATELRVILNSIADRAEDIFYGAEPDAQPNGTGVP